MNSSQVDRTDKSSCFLTGNTLEKEQEVVYTITWKKKAQRGGEEKEEMSQYDFRC